MEPDNNTNSPNPTDEGTSPIASTNFMREKIKQRPINKKKLLRRTLITVSLAVIFGAVACLTFVFLSPLINNAEFIPSEEALVSSDVSPVFVTIISSKAVVMLISCHLSIPLL